MKYRLSVLCENTVGALSGTLGEHGFSVLIEPAGGEPLLFDTGQGATLLHNAQRMKRDLARVQKIVLSHGHYDHAGGLLPLVQKFGGKDVFAHPGIFTPRNRVKDTGECYPIGMPQDRETLEQAGARFDFSPEFREIAPGMFLTGEVPRVTPFEIGDQGIYCDCTGQELDVTLDDQSLILETDKGLVILLGCCHAGLVNTLEHIAYITGRRDIYAVIGGTHLGFCGQEQLDRTIGALKGLAIRKLVAAHCTGFAASSRLSREFPREFQVAMVGYTLEV